jgi:hypothetical protein
LPEVLDDNRMAASMNLVVPISELVTTRLCNFKVGKGRLAGIRKKDQSGLNIVSS